MKKTTIAWILLYGLAIVLNVALALYPTQPMRDIVIFLLTVDIIVLFFVKIW